MKSIFVSSTFRDMQAERDVLKSKVQPMLNDIARQYGESISFSDLRWGVDTSEMSEEEQNRQVLSVCLDEIDRSRPYMIVLLGERYGYMPGPETIAEEANKRPGMHLPDLDISVTQLEIEYGALSTKESLAHTYFYFRELDADDLPEGFKETSDVYISHLQSLKERIKELAGDHVRFYKAHWNGSSVEGLDALVSLVMEDLQAELLPVWQEMSRLNIAEKTKRIQDAYIAERSLSFIPEKERKPQYRDRKFIDLFLHNYVHAADHAEKKEYKIYEKSINADGISSWISATRTDDAFSLSVARELYCRERFRYGHKYPAIVLKGDKGAGKTMYMIHICGIMQKLGFRVIEIHAGSAALFSDSKGILLYTVYRIEEIMGVKHKYLKSETFDPSELLNSADIDEILDYEKELIIKFSEDKDLYSKGRILVAIDGIEKLRNDSYKERMAYVSECVTDKVRVLLSADNSEYIPPMEKIIDIGVSNTQDKYSLAEGALLYHGKQFGKDVKDALVRKDGSSNALYLFFAVNRLSMMDAEDFKAISEKGDDIEAINEHLIEMIESFPGDLKKMSMLLLEAAAEKISPKIIRCAEYIALSRNGFRSDDLISLLKFDNLNIGGTELLQFINFISDLFIVREDGSYDFMHSCTRDALLENINDRDVMYRNIQSYLKYLEVNDSIRISEYLWYCLCSGKYEDATSFICSCMNKEDRNLTLYAQDFVQWAKEAEEKDIYSLFGTVNDIDNGNAASLFFSFIIDHCIDAFGNTKNDEDTLDRIAGTLIDRYSDLQDEDINELFAKLYIRLGLLYTDAPNRNILRRSYDYLNKAYALSGKENEKLICLAGMLEIADNTDEKEIREKTDELINKIIEAADKYRGDKAYGEAVARADFAYGKHMIRTLKLVNLAKGTNAIIDALDYYQNITNAKDCSLEDRYMLIKTYTSLAEARFVWKTPEELERVSKCYNMALNEARFLRDRYKDLRARTAYVDAHAHQAVYDYGRSVRKYSLNEYFTGGDYVDSMEDCREELFSLYNEMHTEKSIYLNYWIDLKLGDSFKASYKDAVMVYKEAYEYLSMLKDVIPFYDRLRCECARGISRNEIYTATGQEEIGKAIDHINYSRSIAVELGNSEDFEDRLEKARFYYTQAHIDRYTLKGTEENRRRALNTVEKVENIFYEYAQNYNTVDSLIEYGKLLLLKAEIYDDLGAMGFEEEEKLAGETYNRVKNIYNLTKKRGAQAFAADLFGMNIIMMLDKLERFERERK